MPTRATKTKSTGTKRAATKKTRSTKTATRGASHHSSHGKRKWSAGVNTESTYPQEGLFKKDAATIARSLASKKVSPKGPSSGMRMLTFYVNRAGKNLPKSRLHVLERAKELLHERMETMKGGTGRRSVTPGRGR
jgi:tRNA(adenine34) deaminase